MTTYISVHRVVNVKVETDNYGDFKTFTIKVEGRDGQLDLTLFTYDLDLNIEA